MFAHQLRRELDELLLRIHSGRMTMAAATALALATIDGFTDSRMNVQDVRNYAAAYVTMLPLPDAAKFAATLSVSPDGLRAT